MELIVTFVMAHGTMVITILLAAIILCVFALLVMGFHSPRDFAMGDLGPADRIEGVLRRILSEQQWPKSTSSGVEVDADQLAMFRDQIDQLEKDLIEKQNLIEKIQSTHGADTANTTAAGETPDTSELKQKVKDLEEKLAEYAVIEEDIADLSKYRQENEELRNKITQVSGVPAAEAVVMPWDEFEKAVKEKKVKSAKDNVDTNIQNKE